MKQLWELKQATETGVLELYIYGDVQGDGYDWWTDQTIESETSANHFREELAKYPNVTQINVYINSSGGTPLTKRSISTALRAVWPL